MIVSALLLDVYKMAEAVPEIDTSLSADYAANGLIYLNQMLDSWAARGMHSPYHAADSYTWTSGNISRTIGATGNFAGQRPIKIVAAYIRENGVDEPVSVISFDEYQKIPSKSETGKPRVFAYQETATNGTVYAWPVPEQSYTVVFVREYVTPALSASDDYLPQPGWLEAVRYNLAVKVAAIYKTQVSPYHEMEARASLKAIRNAAFQETSASLPSPVFPSPGVGNIDRIGY